jgi:hypothetical protein
MSEEVLRTVLKEFPKEISQIQPKSQQPNVELTTDKGYSISPTTQSYDDSPDNTSLQISTLPPNSYTTDHASTQAYVEFCKFQSPLGDMRKVVVAAEGASRFLGMTSISENELGQLFKIAGWKEPTNYLQCLRNAARSKFRWLERIPGKSGYYYVTKLGTDRVLLQ